MPTNHTQQQNNTKKPQTFDFQKAKGNAVLLSIQFVKQQPDLITSNDTMYQWNGKFFEQLSEHDIHRLIFKFFEANGILPSWKYSKAEEMIRAMKANHQIPEVPEVDNPEKNLLNLNNVVLDLDTLEEHGHNPKYYFTYLIDINYNPNKTHHPYFTDFLFSLFRIDEDRVDDEVIDLIFYIIAYLIYPKLKINTMFLFLGGGANGKSVLIEIMKRFFPQKYVTALSLNTLSKEESFSRSALLYSKLNIATEIKTNKIDSDEIKKITNGEEIMIDRKHREPLKIKPKTKILFSGNSFPFFNDTTDGITRRLTMINFPNKFVLPEEYENTINPVERGIYPIIPQEEILANVEKEKSAILNTLIDYLIKLKDRDWNLPDTDNTKSVKQGYKEESDVFGTWLLDNYEIDHTTPNKIFPSATDILIEYKQYHEETNPGGKFKISAAHVGRKIKQYFRVDGERRNRDVMSGSQMKTVRTTIYPITKIDDTPPTQEIILDQPEADEQLRAFTNQ